MLSLIVCFMVLIFYRPKLCDRTNGREASVQLCRFSSRARHSSLFSFQSCVVQFRLERRSSKNLCQSPSFVPAPSNRSKILESIELNFFPRTIFASGINTRPRAANNFSRFLGITVSIL